MGYVVSFEKPLRIMGTQYVTDVELSILNRMTMSDGIDLPVRYDYDCYFRPNPFEFDREGWPYRDVK